MKTLVVGAREGQERDSQTYEGIQLPVEQVTI